MSDLKHKTVGELRTLKQAEEKRINNLKQELGGAETRLRWINKYLERKDFSYEAYCDQLPPGAPVPLRSQYLRGQAADKLLALAQLTREGGPVRPDQTPYDEAYAVYLLDKLVEEGKAVRVLPDKYRAATAEQRYRFDDGTTAYMSDLQQAGWRPDQIAQLEQIE